MPHEEHRKRAQRTLKCAVITISTSRYTKRADQIHVKDESGDIICRMLRKNGHKVLYRAIVPDSMTDIRTKLLNAFQLGIDAVITTGGTGISPTDVTIESVSPLLERELPGFGELFRQRSSESIGTASIMSRALLGVMHGMLIACLPGSPDGVKTGMELLMPELQHASSIAKGS
ncbi:MAG: MogA/MoaB family molybdenum cofactor biosynthesis protein [Conexivisphaerales archaeon]